MAGWGPIERDGRVPLSEGRDGYRGEYCSVCGVTFHEHYQRMTATVFHSWNNPQTEQITRYVCEALCLLCWRERNGFLSEPEFDKRTPHRQQQSKEHTAEALGITLEEAEDLQSVLNSINRLENKCQR